MMPSAAELARLRADVEAYALPDTCNVLSLTRTPDGEGGWTNTWGTATANVACRLDLSISRGVGIVGAESVRSASLKPFSTWILTAAHGTALDNTNRVEVNGDTFNVVEVDDARSWNAHVRATLERV